MKGIFTITDETRRIQNPPQTQPRCDCGKLLAWKPDYPKEVCVDHYEGKDGQVIADTEWILIWCCWSCKREFFPTSFPMVR